ncbi:coiled-coil domain-containing protein 81-like [Rhynchocyon petersi]
MNSLPSTPKKRGRQVLPTLPLLSQEDVSTIWEKVSEFVERQLLMNKGVQIPGLGIFTFTRQRLEVGYNRFIFLRRPVFILAEKLVQLHGLEQNKIYTPGDIPVIPLNFTMLSVDLPFTRDIVEGCVRETLLFLSRTISTEQSVEFTFKGIGVLVIRESKVKMRFYKDFLSTVDGSGNLVKALTNRPGTVDSVLSSTEALKKHPSSEIAFPRTGDKDTEVMRVLSTIIEEDEENKEKKEEMKGQLDKRGFKRSNSPKRFREKQSIPPIKVTNIAFTDMSKQIGSDRKTTSRENIKSAGSQKLAYETKLKMSPTPSSRQILPTPSSQEISPTPSCRDHNKAGQELCYVCLQRMQRNTPSYYDDEWKKRDEEDERLLQRYQLQKAEDALAEEQLKNRMARRQNQKNAAYNLSVAEAVRKHKNGKPEFYESYIFPNRPLTAEVNARKQEEYSQSLLKQIDDQRKQEMKQRENEELLEHLEKVQLAKEVAAQKAKSWQEKTEESRRYKRALDAQIKNKPYQLPVFEPDSSAPIFGRNDDRPKMSTLERQYKFVQHQIEAAANRRKKDTLDKLATQKQDLQMLERTHKELLADKAAKQDQVNKLNQELKKDWEKNAKMKKKRDLEQKAFDRAPDNLLLDQCASVKRCKQCQRDTSNVGKSNLCPVNKHMPGSRMFI